MNIQQEWLVERLSTLSSVSKPLSSGERKALSTLDVNQGSAVCLQEWLDEVINACGLEPAIWLSEPDVTCLPMVAWLPELGFRLITGRAIDGGWRVDGPRGSESLMYWPEHAFCSPIQGAQIVGAKLSAGALFKSIFFADRQWLFFAAVVALFGNFLALGASLYSMQVYDRVIPTQGISTLIVLTVGTGFAITLELFLKLARSGIVNNSLRDIDVRLSHAIFERLLRLRMDQFPAQVGSLSGQIRGYETIRGFVSSVSLFLTADAPFAFMFLIVIGLVGGPQLVIVPVTFMVASLIVGLMYRKRISAAASSGAGAGNNKMGLLVEAVDGAETIKATGSAWQFLSRWNLQSREAVKQDVLIRHLSETSTYIGATLQQYSYIALVAMGAYVSTTGTLTSGALIACSMLSGRVLSPIAMIPGLLVQWAHAKAAHISLEKVFELKMDNHDVDRPLSPEQIHGQYILREVGFSYEADGNETCVSELSIHPGERVAILGSIGSGKSTLLRLLAGLYRPQKGRVLLDGLDLQQICRTRLSEAVGYLPQQTRLFNGSLRDNLMLGLPSKPDSEILEMAKMTGLMPIISQHPQGLDRQIAEGGGGLSGGQRQLVALTRLFLASPRVWLLDEPTASMDAGTEANCLRQIEQTLIDNQTLVLVTHKPALLALVDRFLVMTPNGILLDGPRDAVLKQLTKGVEAKPSYSAGVS